MPNKLNFDFLDSCRNTKHKWFVIDEYEPSKSVLESAFDYISQFGLEKSSKNFSLEIGLKTAIAHYFRRHEIKCEESNIIVRRNIFDILGDIYKAVEFKNGEKILFTLPISGYLVQQCYDLEIGTEFLNTDRALSYKIDLGKLALTLKTQKIKILFLNYPNNITGTTVNKIEALALAKIIAEHKDLLVIVDESLREIILDQDAKTYSLGAISEIEKQIITLSSLKYSTSAHLDVAFACIKNKAIFAKTYSEKVTIPTSTQHIAISALEENEDSEKHLSEVIEECRQNSDLVAAELKNINQNLSKIFEKNSEFIKPILGNLPARNSMLLDFKGLQNTTTSDHKVLKTDLQMAEFLNEKADIAMMPGQYCFLPEEEMILRMYLLKSKKELKEGFKKINQAVLSLRMLSHTISKAQSLQLSNSDKNRVR